jgi:galactose oxidase
VADIAQHTAVAKTVQPSLLEHNEIIMAEQARPAVVVGITPLCPYGLGPCWAGAHDALHEVSDIEVVRPVPHQADSVAFVYLKQDILPDIDVWRSEFAKGVNRSYDMRGIEMTLSGVVTRKQTGANQQMTLAGTSTRPELILAPFQETSQIKWDMAAKAPKPIFGGGRRVRTAIGDVGGPSGGSEGAGDRDAPEARRQRVFSRRPRFRGIGCRRLLAWRHQPNLW